MDKFFVKRTRDGYTVFEDCGILCEMYICSCNNKGTAELIAKLLNWWYDRRETFTFVERGVEENEANS